MGGGCLKDNESELDGSVVMLPTAGRVGSRVSVPGVRRECGSRIVQRVVRGSDEAMMVAYC